MKKITIAGLCFVFSFAFVMLMAPGPSPHGAVNISTKSTGDSFTAAELNLIVNDLNGNKEHSFFITDVTAWTNKTIPIWLAPKDATVTITQISAGVIGGGTVSFRLTETPFATMGTIDGASSTICAATDFNAIGNDVTVFADAAIALKGVVSMAVDQVTGEIDDTIGITAVVGTIYYTESP